MNRNQRLRWGAVVEARGAISNGLSRQLPSRLRTAVVGDPRPVGLSSEEGRSKRDRFGTVCIAFLLAASACDGEALLEPDAVPSPVAGGAFATANSLGDAVGLRWTSGGGSRVYNTTQNPAPFAAQTIGFEYGPDAPEDQSRAELSFVFVDEDGQPVDRGPEVWMEWWVRFADNSVDRERDGPRNKKLYRLYPGDRHAQPNYVNPIKLGASTYPVGSATTPDLVFAPEYKHLNGGMGVLAQHGGSSQAFMSEHVVPGQWFRIRAYHNVGTPAAAIVRYWINNTLIHQRDDMQLSPEPQGRGYGQGYFFGAANGGYAERTIHQATGFRFWNTDPGW